jgi:hypothetical protein
MDWDVYRRAGACPRRVTPSKTRGTVKTVPYGMHARRGTSPFPSAIARHGRRPGTRTVMGKARICPQITEDGIPKGRAALCKKPFPLACLSSDSFRTSGKNRPPEGRTSRRIPPGHPGRLAAPAQENNNRQKGRGTVKTVPYGATNRRFGNIAAGASPRPTGPCGISCRFVYRTGLRVKFRPPTSPPRTSPRPRRPPPRPPAGTYPFPPARTARPSRTRP